MPGKQTLLNLYTHNQHTIDIGLTLNNADEYNKSDKAIHFTFDSETDVLDLGMFE